jgi:L-threonylcarbamoyladenylate synthase
VTSPASLLEDCIAGGGIAVFPADTVYGLACDPEDPRAVARLYELKGRPQDKPAAVMFFSVSALPDLPPRTAALAGRLLPGAVTLLVANPQRRFPLACGPDPDTLGIRVPDIPVLAAVTRPVLQTSANLAGGPDARTLDDVPVGIRSEADLVLDAGTLPGTPSTVIDLRDWEDAGVWRIVRAGAVPESAVAAAAEGL